MKKYSKHDYPIRTLCILIERGNVPFVKVFKEFTEKVNIIRSDPKSLPISGPIITDE
ncbi:MAG TPA: hypothetical protein VMX17_12635 [Candidatus Glassbacteria bacterium]|nr:hypothetical protein [Candidatus Glassbacteria bacterium]